MAIIVNNKPENFDLSKNMMPVSVSSDTNLIISPGTAPSIDLVYDTGSLAGGYFIFRWESDSVTFYITATSTPDPSNNLLRPQNVGESVDDYVAYVVSEFNDNVKFSKYFDIAVSPSSTDLIHIVAKEIDEEYVIDLVGNINTGFGKSVGPFVPANVLDTVMSIQMDIEISEDNQSATFLPVTSKIQECIAGDAIFYIEEIIDSFLQYHIPQFGGAAVEAVLSTYKKIRLTFYERFGNPKENYSVSVYNIYKVLKAGWPKIDFQKVNRDNYSTVEAYYDFSGIWLTRAPRNKKIIPGQQEFLYYLFLNQITTPQVDMNVSAYYEGDNQVYSTIYSLSVPDQSVYCYPVSIEALGISLFSGTNKLLYYRVFLEIDGVGFTESVKYTIDYDNYVDNTIYQFTNSDSGVDTVRFTGKLEESSEFDYDQAKRLISYPYDVNEGEFFDRKTFRLKQFKQNSGWITKEECKWLDEFFIAEKKFLQGTDGFIPIVITSKTKPVKSSQQNLYSFSFEYFIAFEDVVTEIDLSHGLKP